MLSPQISLTLSPQDSRVLRIADQTGEYSLANYGGFGAPNATRLQVRGTISIYRAADNYEILQETALPADFFTTQRAYDFGVPFSDCAATVTISVYSKFGQPVWLYSYLLPPQPFPTDSHLFVQKGTAWVEVTSSALVVNGMVTWIKGASPDIYTNWVIATSTGSIIQQGQLTQTSKEASTTKTQTGTTELLIGRTNQFLLADVDFQRKLGLIAAKLDGQPDNNPSLAPLLGAWGKLYFDYQRLKAQAPAEMPSRVDALLTKLHLMADRLL